jgi:aspartate/methionine/tyrosine aminotransferase
VFGSQGASGILNTIIKTIKECCDKKNAEVIMFAPEYSLFHTIISENNLHPMVLKGKRENNYIVSTDDIKHAINDNTIGIIFSNPNNPTCQTYKKEWIRKLVDMCKPKNISIIVDEIYRSTTYNNNHVFIEKYNNGFKNLFKVFSLSKDRPGFTGIRSGYCIFDTKFKEIIRKHQISQNFSNTIFADFLLLIDISMRNYLITGTKSNDLKYFPQNYLKQYESVIINFYKQQKELNTYVVQELKKNKHVIDIIYPDAGNSIWFRYKDDLTPDEFVQTFIQKGLAIYAGDVFMHDNKTEGSWARICVTKSKKVLKDGILKI